jgi:sulfite reductase (NADPH) flavoprotein alpha-component
MIPDWGLSSERLAAAVSVIVLYGLLCAGVWRTEQQRHRRARSAAASLTPSADDGAIPVLIAHASQTGTAEELAWQTARSLQLAGVPARIASLSTLAAGDLQRAQRALFIVSTYGEGDPPDAAAPFARGAMVASAPLTALHYGMLALGDREYVNFCGFGRSLDRWLSNQGARPMFDRVDVDNGDPHAIGNWRQLLARIAGTSDAPDWAAPSFTRWRVMQRRLLNAGSSGEPVFHVELDVAEGLPRPGWEAGDLLQIVAPADPERPREYSIASIPSDGSVHLLVRQSRHPDGTLGMASGWLTAQATADDVVEARIRPHRSFRLAGNATRPLILIGNGTGLAGLRSLLKARAQAASARGESHPARDGHRDPPPGWLVFGERNAAFDRLYGEEIAAWQAQRVLTRCDWVFSRDQPQRRYVQHLLAESAADVLGWVEDGAAIYVCGSLEGMAAGVDAALTEILGRERLDAMIREGRLRRDVY